MTYETLLKNLQRHIAIPANELESVKKQVREKFPLSFKAGEYVFRYQEPGHSVYLLIDGELEVYQLDESGDVITLAKLLPGDIVGEGARFNGGVRNANVITARDSKLLEISSIITASMATELYKLFLSRLDVAVNTQREILKKYAAQSRVYRASDVIFSAGELAIYCYFILSGQVSIELVKHGKTTIQKLHEGSLFGEAALMNNHPRMGTATAITDCQVLLIGAEAIKAIKRSNPFFSGLFNTLTCLYRGTDGTNSLVFSSSSAAGSLLSTLTVNETGDHFLYTKNQQKNLFTLSWLVDFEDLSTVRYRDSERKIEREITHHHGAITKIVAWGDWPELPNLVRIAAQKQTLQRWQLKKFARSGDIDLMLSDQPNSLNQYICQCSQTSYEDLMRINSQEEIQLENIMKRTGAGTLCGACLPALESLFGTGRWLRVTLHEKIPLSNKVYLISLKGMQEPLPDFNPGQHAVFKINTRYGVIQRSYTLIRKQNACWQIIVELTDFGVFSAWLSKSEAGDMLYCSEPKGRSIKLDRSVNTLFVVSGVGITPVLSVLDHLSEKDFIYHFCEENAYCYAYLKRFGIRMPVHYKKMSYSNFSALTEAIKNHSIKRVYCYGSSHLVTKSQHLIETIKYDALEFFSELFSSITTSIGAKTHGQKNEILPNFLSGNDNADTAIHLLHEIYRRAFDDQTFLERTACVNDSKFLLSEKEVVSGAKLIVSSHLGIDPMDIEVNTNYYRSQSQDYRLAAEKLFNSPNLKFGPKVSLLILPLGRSSSTFALDHVVLHFFNTIELTALVKSEIKLEKCLRYLKTKQDFDEMPRQETWLKGWLGIGHLALLANFIFRPVDSIMRTRKKITSTFKNNFPFFGGYAFLNRENIFNFLNLPKNIVSLGPLFLKIIAIGHSFPRKRLLSGNHLDDLLMSVRHYFEEILQPERWHDYQKNIKQTVSGLTARWESKLNLKEKVAELFISASLSCTLDSYLFQNHIRDNVSLLFPLLDAPDVVQIAKTITPFKVLTKKHRVTKKLYTFLKKIVENEASVAKSKTLSDLFAFKVAGQTVDPQDVPWLLLNYMWHSVVYPSSYGFWCLIFILQNKSVVSALRDLNSSRREELLEACLLETIRLYPVAMLARAAKYDLEVVDNGRHFELKKEKNICSAVMYELCRDSSIYTKADQFDPFRYENNEPLPALFGQGPYSCPATLYTKKLITTVLDELLQQFDLEVIEKISKPRCRISLFLPKKTIHASASRRT